MTEPYDLRSNIKGKPGSQGTLFQVKDKGLLNPQQRWPKGYTPERLTEVRKGLKDTTVVPPDHLYSGPDDHVQKTKGVNSFGYRARVEDTIARTTVPGRDLQGLRTIHGEPDSGDDASYWPGRHEVGVDMTHSDSARSLVHELGHHYYNDHSLDAQRTIPEVAESHAWRDKGKYQERPNATGKVMAQAKVQEGVHEALADSYYEQHYRTGGRNSQPEGKGGLYEQMFTTEKLDQHYPGYTDVRPSPYRNMGPQFKQERLF